MFVIYENAGNPIVRKTDTTPISDSGTHIITKAEDLQPLSSNLLIKLYNKATKQSIKKFSDKTTAANRTFIQLEALSAMGGELKMGKSKVLVAKDAPKDVKTSTHKPKSQGVIATFKAMALRPQGVSLDEAVAQLKELFPDREAKGMRATCSINTNPKASPGMSWSKTRDPKRGGIVYKLKVD